jgi:hypothetical protein
MVAIGGKMDYFYLDRDAKAHPIPRELFVEAADASADRIRALEGVLTNSPVGVVLPWPVEGYERYGSGMFTVFTDPDKPRRFHAIVVNGGATIKTRFGHEVTWTGEEFEVQDAG